MLISLLILSVYPLVGMCAVQGEWTFTIENGGATITASTATGAVTIPSAFGGYSVLKVGSGSSPVFVNFSSPVTSVTIPNSVTTLEPKVFQGCAQLTSVTLSTGLTTIKDFAFQDCSSLTSITIPNSVTSIGASAFYNCISLSSITIGSGVTSIGYSAFNYCTSLASITIPNSVTSIGASAFLSCASLTSISIPNSVTILGGYAFSGCTSLTSVTIGNGVTSLEGVFLECASLTTVSLGSGLTRIGSYAFYNCLALARVEFLGNAPSYVSTSFINAFPIFYYVTGKTGWGSSYAGLSTAVLGSYLLTTVCSDAQGTILVNPLKSAYQSTDSVTISVNPKSGYLFNAWSGASTATTSSITFTMNSNKTVTANFIQDSRDADGDGLTNYQESITYGTNPNLKDTNSDGVEDGRAVTLGYSPTFNFGALTSYWQGTPPTGLYTASQMQAMAFGDLVLTKNANGSFTLNYDIEQSTDLQNWSIYAPLSLPLTNLPPDKAFIRIKAKQ